MGIRKGREERLKSEEVGSGHGCQYVRQTRSKQISSPVQVCGMLLPSRVKSGDLFACQSLESSDHFESSSLGGQLLES